MDYLELNLRIGPRQGQQYPVSVTSSEGEGRGVFAVPFTPDELGRLPAAFRENLDAVDLLSAEEVGERLFEALFRGQIGTRFAACLGRLGSGEAERLRIVLDLATEPEILRLPWELLRDPASGIRPALSRRISLVRCFDLPRPRLKADLPDGLRVLVMSSLSDPELGLEQEARSLREALSRAGGVTVEVLDRPRLADLRAKLHTGSFHVLHYMGHGDFLARYQEGRLVLQTEDGEDDDVSGHDLATAIGDVADLRLVVVNACHSGRDGGRSASRPFAGVATAFLQAGVPAVVAMQEPICDQAAVAFSRAFYHHLAAGEPVETAMAEGRMAIFNLSDATRREAEWAVPVLFRRASGGDLVLASPRRAPWPAIVAAGLLVTLIGTAALTWRGRPQNQASTAGEAAVGPRSLTGDVAIAAPSDEESPVVLSEVCANPEGDDTDREWIELANLGPRSIDLAGYSIGAGGGSYLDHVIQLKGSIGPGETFVLGGVLSSPANGSPRFDLEISLRSVLQNGGNEADGVALFDVPRRQVTPTTLSIDVVIYGGPNVNRLVDENGFVGPPDVGAPSPGMSIERVDWEGNWEIRSTPTPNSSPLFETEREPR